MKEWDRTEARGIHEERKCRTETVDSGMANLHPQLDCARMTWEIHLWAWNWEGKTQPKREWQHPMGWGPGQKREEGRWGASSHCFLRHHRVPCAQLPYVPAAIPEASPTMPWPAMTDRAVDCESNHAFLLWSHSNDCGIQCRLLSGV